MSWSTFSSQYNYMYHLTKASNLPNMCSKNSGTIVFECAKSYHNQKFNQFEPRLHKEKYNNKNEQLNYQLLIYENSFCSKDWSTILDNLDINFPTSTYQELYNSSATTGINLKAYYYMLDHFVFFFASTKKANDKRKKMMQGMSKSYKELKVLIKIETDIFNKIIPTHHSLENSGSNNDRRLLDIKKDPNVIKKGYPQPNDELKVVEILYKESLEIPLEYVMFSFFT